MVNQYMPIYQSETNLPVFRISKIVKSKEAHSLSEPNPVKFSHSKVCRKKKII
jgi:hypothetical protein